MNSSFQAAEDRVRSMREIASASVKAASSGPMTAYGAGAVGSSGLGLGLDGGVAKHAEQYRYFRDWVYTSIAPKAKRLANQQFFVASLSATAAMRTAKALAEAKNDKGFIAKLARAQFSLPECFKALGERLEPIDNHPILEMIGNPNDVMVGWQSIYVLVASLELTGEAIWWLDDFETKNDSQNGAQGGGKWKIWSIPSHWATPVHTDQKLFHHWDIRSPRMTEPIPVPGDRIVYYYLPDPSEPLSSLSAVQAQARSIATDDQIQSSQYHLMKHGIRPDVIVTAGRLPGTEPGRDGMRPHLTTEQRSQIIEMIKLACRGPMQAGEPFIVDGLIESVNPFSRTPAEMGFFESGKITKNRVMLGLGTNSIVAGEVEGVNRASSAAADENFCNSINPLGTLISQVASVRIAPLFAKNGEKLIVWMDPCQPHDPELKIRKWQAGNQDTTPNEVRTILLNLPPSDDEFADTPHYKIPKVGLPAPAGGAAGAAANANGKPKKPKPKPNPKKPGGTGATGEVQPSDTGGGGNKPGKPKKPKRPLRKPTSASPAGRKPPRG
jgi:hypothetical protein